MRAARCLLLWAAVSVTGWSTASRQWRERGGGIGIGNGDGDGDGRAHREEEITRPQRLQQRADGEGGELAHGRLDTRVKSEDADALHPIHLAQLSFLVKAFGTSFILDLELNHDLLSSDYVERHFDEDRTPFHNQGGEHCYYHGTVRGAKGSWVALSTCHGLWGMFSDGNFSYGIEPLPHVDEQGQNAHVVYRLPDLQLNAPHCPECNATNDPESAVDDVTPVSAESDGPTFTHGLRRVKRQIRRPPRTVQTETKYIELLVVNDYDLFVQMRRSTAQTRNFAKAIVNMADAIYKEQLNTRLVLVAMETWSSQNMVSVGDDPLMTLRDFMKYRRENIKEKSDAAHLFSGRTFQSSRSGTAYIGGICSATRGGGVNEYGNVGPMAITLCQSLGQNLGMMWNKDRATAGDCRCPDPWLGCIMEDTGYYLPRKFSRCSVEEYVRFLQDGGGSCLFNKPTKLLDPPECGNGFVEQGEECDCGSQVECSRAGGACCKKCTLTHDAMCSNGLCCNRCRYEQRGVVCRDAVNDCDIPEMCPGDSSQCPPNVHKLDGYMCDTGQGRCYGGRCKTRDGQCQALWGHTSRMMKRFTQKSLPNGLQKQKRHLKGHVRGGHAVLEDGSDLGYVEDGTPCGPNMMCLERRCVPVMTFNLSVCPGSSTSHICSDHGTCSNEVKCICDSDYTGKDCSVYDPLPDPQLPEGPEKYKGPSGTNIIIGSLAGAILLAAIVLGGTGWGFKNIRRGRSGGG
ncbi:hypothetical protein PGIGA_G00031690 [Pangasianodon gigas]|uniref:Uncharacterized protein n=1 Tax=Pangasianodon gigas TaxID=30993 RepID=A0ACC5WY88_PANGG|nr:hypothetical protein [Pangasianodon gigas]